MTVEDEVVNCFATAATFASSVVADDWTSKAQTGVLVTRMRQSIADSKTTEQRNGEHCIKPSLEVRDCTNRNAACFLFCKADILSTQVGVLFL